MVRIKVCIFSDPSNSDGLGGVCPAVSRSTFSCTPRCDVGIAAGNRYSQNLRIIHNRNTHAVSFDRRVVELLILRKLMFLQIGRMFALQNDAVCTRHRLGCIRVACANLVILLDLRSTDIHLRAGSKLLCHKKSGDAKRTQRPRIATRIIYTSLARSI